MKAVAIHDAKTNLSKYIAAAKRGEKIYIGNRGKAEVVLTVIDNSDKPKRKLGILKKEMADIPDLPDLEAIDKSPEWQEVIRMMNDDPLYHE